MHDINSVFMWIECTGIHVLMATFYFKEKFACIYCYSVKWWFGSQKNFLRGFMVWWSFQKQHKFEWFILYVYKLLICMRFQFFSSALSLSFAGCLCVSLALSRCITFSFGITFTWRQNWNQFKRTHDLNF